jgi:hypothetical protein
MLLSVAFGPINDFENRFFKFKSFGWFINV